MADVKALAENLVGLTVKEVQELAEFLKSEYGIEPAAAAVVMSSGGCRCRRRPPAGWFRRGCPFRGKTRSTGLRSASIRHGREHRATRRRDARAQKGWWWRCRCGMVSGIHGRPRLPLQPAACGCRVRFPPSGWVTRSSCRLSRFAA